MTKDCNRSNIDEISEKSNCVGYEIAMLSVWTEMQCLDNCLRHPNCDNYIFDRQENQTCKLLYTGDIASVPGAVSLTTLDGRCASKNATVSELEILGSEFDCKSRSENLWQKMFGMLLCSKEQPIRHEENIPQTPTLIWFVLLRFSRVS